ncbi:MAG TPA: GspH/FimT family pseudopilin [Pyrinomonadaceae bacterium]|nr:GspH/FimT family pseudopilin [Pyrinomonadaceae bacterium]
MITDTKIELPRKRNGESGIGIPELLVVVAVIAIISTVALVNFRSARASLRMQNSVRQLASYLEKARIDAVRRHSTADVTFTSPTSYTVHMDFLNTGSATDRTFNFESGVQIASVAELPKITFNWRGRTITAGALCVTTFSVKNDINPNDGLNVDVSGSGDVTVENQQPTLPNIPYTEGISASSPVRYTTVVSSTDTVDNTPCLDVSGEGVPSEAGPPECQLNISASSISVKKNGGSNSVKVGTSVSTLVVASYPSNLTITPSSQTVSTPTSFLIKSTNNLKGPFPVTFTAQCGASIPLKVNVTN